MILPFLTYTIQYPIVLAIFFINLFADPKPRQINLDDQIEKLTPERWASFFSKAVFAWFDPFAWKGFRNLLKYDDLYNLKAENRCNHVVPVWDKYWNRMMEDKKKKQGKKAKLSITSTLAYAFGPAYALSALYQLGYSVFQVTENPWIKF